MDTLDAALEMDEDFFSGEGEKDMQALEQLIRKDIIKGYVMGYV